MLFLGVTPQWIVRVYCVIGCWHCGTFSESHFQDVQSQASKVPLMGAIPCSYSYVIYIYVCMSLYCIILHSFGIANIHWLRWFSPFTLNKEFDLMCSSPHFHRDFAIPNMLGMPIHDGEMTIPHWLTMATHLVKLGVTPPFSGIPHLISLVIILYIWKKNSIIHDHPLIIIHDHLLQVSQTNYPLKMVVFFTVQNPLVQRLAVVKRQDAPLPTQRRLYHEARSYLRWTWSCTVAKCQMANIKYLKMFFSR